MIIKINSLFFSNKYNFNTSPYPKYFNYTPITSNLTQLFLIESSCLCMGCQCMGIQCVEDFNVRQGKQL